MGKSTVLVTGGAGFIGSHCVIELLKDGYNVVVIDNCSNSILNIHEEMPESLVRVRKLLSQNLHYYNVDCTNYEALSSVFSKHNIDYVMHLAGLKAVGESCEKPLFYYQVNLGSTLNLIDVMTKYKCYNLVFSSSATVYGEPQKLPVGEAHPTGGCTNPYGSSKHFQEQILFDISKSDPKWNIVLLRYFNPIGAHESGLIGENPQGIPNNLMPYVAQVASGKREFVNVFGSDYDTVDGTGVRDYIHVQDLALGHTASLVKLKADCGCKIYNLGTGKGYSVLEMIKAMERASGKEIPYRFVKRREGDLASVYGDVSLAEEELHWKATRELDGMCVDLWRWQTLNPNGFGDQLETKSSGL